MLNIAITGSLGRMGQRISALAGADPQLNVMALLERQDHPDIKEKSKRIPLDIGTDSIKAVDVLIDFTLPEGTMHYLKACVEHKVAMVIGTTGMTVEQTRAIEDASKSIPIVFSSNMSVGVNVFFKATEMLARQIGARYDISIHEIHHVHKKDAPSGTAKTLGQIAEEFSGKALLDISSERTGEVIGDHTITFESDEDILKVQHQAKNRDIFAKGALVAAKFLKNQSNGLYNMQDVLGLNS